MSYTSSTHASLIGIMPWESKINLTNERYLNMTTEQFDNELNEQRNVTLNQTRVISHELITGDIKDVVEVVHNAHPTAHVVLIHGCNCHNNMGAGLAKRIKQLYPEAYQADQNTVAHSRDKLGTLSGAKINNNLSVVNLYTQYNYGGNVVNVDYTAMRKCFELLVDNAMVDYIFLIPKNIGCGLAGGDINIVTPMIEECFKSQAYYLFDK